ncbi:hypothetical protein [Nocardia mexicana]|uniref:Uncharacterized protein n=1 Tax=Nocardia mexicana TaxID=279262 RepID=A0A370HBT8_9NOCA|nr:hypothetical protein [Nocardia mexicana]RDI54413.1 hypothetical protein DFR68_102538 [Nocardia mexicana]
MQPTPWRGSNTASDPAVTPDTRQEVASTRPEVASRHPDLRPYLLVLRENWGYSIAVVGGIITLVLLFQPWLTARGPAGTAYTNAFGRITATNNLMNAWSTHGPAPARILGIWGLLASGAIILMCVTAIANLRRRSDSIARITVISSLAVAVFVLLALVYINTKAPDLKGMTSRRYDLGGQIGSMMTWAFGNGRLVIPGMGKSAEFSSASLSPWALLAGATAITCAAFTCIQWIREHPGNSFRWRSPFVMERTKDSGRGEKDPDHSERSRSEKDPGRGKTEPDPGGKDPDTDERDPDRTD